MKALFSSVVFAALCIFLAGCQTTETNSDSLAAPDRAAVSSIPWNKPASWEGTGALGGFMPQGGR
jgi:hypothetical protein